MYKLSTHSKSKDKPQPQKYSLPFPHQQQPPQKDQSFTEPVPIKDKNSFPYPPKEELNPKFSRNSEKNPQLTVLHQQYQQLRDQMKSLSQKN